MNEQENNNTAFETNKNNESNDFLDLGSSPVEEFDPFGAESDFQDDDPVETPSVVENKPNGSLKESKKQTPDEVANPLEAALSDAENKDVEKTKQSLLEKPPVFEYARAAEDIEDTSKTFEELRIEKITDFPEFDDGKRVSWTVEYGKITKTVQTPKETTIASIKEGIEKSKEFLETLKKAKDKNPVCKLKPRVTAQTKGKMSVYKGVFTTLDEAEASGKIISIIPARDGKVYEIRRTEMGRFTTPVSDCEVLSRVGAGFNPALPLIPAEILLQIIGFFRRFMEKGNELEATGCCSTPAIYS